MLGRTLQIAVLTLGVAMHSLEAMAATNGMILITTRRQSDLSQSRTDIDNIKGPGQTTPGDVAMQLFLGDYGYSSRLITVTELDAGFLSPCDSHAGNAAAFLTPADPNYNVNLLILSAASSVADNPSFASFKVPTMTGEFGLLGTGAAGSIKMYSEGGFGNPNATVAGQYMIVTNRDHPIMKGIPVDADGRVKMVRDPYPEENAHIPLDGKPNYEFFWVSAPAANKAPGTTVLGVMGNDTNQSCFAVMDTGGELMDGTTAGNRLVHLWFGEQSSNNARRTFNALSDVGKVIFIRAAKWAMGETLAPYEPLGLVQVVQVNPAQIELSWNGTASKNYKIVGTRNLVGAADLSNWQTVAQDIRGANGIVSAKLDIAAGPQHAFLRVVPVP